MDKHNFFNLILAIIFIGLSAIALNYQYAPKTSSEPLVKEVFGEKKKESYWFVLNRKSNQEFLFLGEPGNEEKSQLVKTFKVKTGVPNQKPTPLPEFVGREYWLLKEKFDTQDSLEIAPYFLTLDVPVSDEEPFGPTPYYECDGEQCNWEIPGAFGLHGVAGDDTRLSDENLGSSGCIRHSDEDIIYLYNLLDPVTDEIRYYIKDI